jgi:hypothetical protein
MTRLDKFSRLTARLLVAAMVAALSLMIVVHAGAAVTVPNETQIFYTVPAGGIFPSSGAGIAVPANVPVLVMGTCITFGFRGVGQVAMLHIPGAFLEWTGLNSPSNGTVTSGFDGGTGSNIVQLDFSGNVHIQINTADTFRVGNTATSSRSGFITMIW